VGSDEGPQPEGEQQLLVRSMAEAMAPLRAPSFFDAMPEAPVRKHLCSNVEGFGLHAARTVEAHDRKGLERLCRYGLRAPFSHKRLSLLPDGRVRYRLPRPWPTPDGATELVLDPVAFLKRLTALMARPYVHLVRYHGVFANRSRDRDRLPQPPTPEDPCESSGQPSTPQDDPPTPRARRTGWARLLKRVLHIDALTCPRCAAAMVVIAFITDPPVVRSILEHLRLPAADPPRAPSRAEEPELCFDDSFTDELQGEVFPNDDPASQRGPP
jgi:hypothetical protein